MSPVYIIATCVLLAFLVAGLFWPEVTFGLGIHGSLLFSIVMGQVLRRESGVSVALLMCLLIGMFLLWKKTGAPLFKCTYGEVSIVALSMAVLVSLYYTNAPEYGRQKALLFAATCVPVYFIARMCAKDKTALHRTLSVTAAVSAASVGVYALLLVVWRSTGYGAVLERFGGGMSIYISFVLAFSVGVMVYWLYNGSQTRKTIAVATIAAAVSLMPFTGSRSGFLMFIIAAMISFMSVNAFFRSLATLAVIMGLMSASLWLFSPEVLYERIGQSGVGIDSYVQSGRAELNLTAIKTFLEHPWNGVGVGGFAERFTGTDRRSYPHNLWLEVASEQGLMGLVPLIVVTVVSTVGIIRLRKSQELAIAKPLQLMFWVGVFQACVTADLPMCRLFFGAAGLLAGIDATPKPLCWRKPTLLAREIRG